MATRKSGGFISTSTQSHYRISIEYLSTLEGILLFYRNNDMQQDIKTAFQIT